MARTQSENYPEIRREILRRSAALFASKGYANTTIADLAEANAMSRGLLYHYFASKEAMLREMLDEHLDYMLAEVRAAAGGQGDGRSKFRKMVHTMMDINARSRDLQIVLLNDLKNIDRAARSKIIGKQREVLNILGQLISTIDETKRTGQRGLRAYTMMVIGMINYTYLWYDPEGPVSPAAYADMVADTCLHSLQSN